MTIHFQDLYPVENPPLWMSVPFQGFCLDSRCLQPGQIFIALTSYSQPEKTLQFAQAALEKGALAIISETALALDGVLVCPTVRQLMGGWQKQYLRATDPVPPTRILAVTGTNGKTTISRLVAELISLQGRKCAVMGTTGNGILPNLEASSHTTLDALNLQNLLHNFAKQGAEFTSLEASSHGLEQGRLNGCEIEIAAYSNLSRDHLDYHGTLEAYAQAKAQLFKFSTLKVAVINIDDAYASVMTVGTHGTTYGGNPLACAVAGEVLSIVNTPQVLNGVKQREQWFKERLQAINHQFALFKEIRGVGLLIGCALRDEYAGKAKLISQLAAEEGLMVLIAGANVVRFAPALIIKEDDVTLGLNRFAAACERFIAGESS